MAKVRRTEITIETQRLLFIRQRREPNAWCPECSRQVGMLTPDRAAAIAHASVRTINRWVEAEMVHFTETSNGLLYICVDSLTTLMSAAYDQKG